MIYRMVVSSVIKQSLRFNWSGMFNNLPALKYVSNCKKVDFLAEASNRKHPTQPQLKILKEKLPELQVLPHIISSNIFRQQLINREFLEGIAQLAKDCFPLGNI